MNKNSASKTQKFKAACHHCGRWALRGAAFGAAIFTTLAITLYAMLGANGVSLNMARPAVEHVLQDRMGADQVSVGDIHLIRDRTGNAPFRMTVTDVRLGQEDGTGINIPGMAVRLDGGDLLRGKTMPRFIEVTGANFTVERRAGGVAVAGEDDQGQSLDIGAIVSQARLAGFEGALLTDLDLTYTNDDTGASFVAKNGEAELIAGPSGYSFQMVVPFEGEARNQLILDVMVNDRSGDLRATLAANGAPADAILPLFLGTNSGVVLDSDVSGTVTATGNLEQGFSQMGMALHASGGELTMMNQSAKVGHLTVNAAFDPEAQRIDLNSMSYQIGENVGTLTGMLGLAFGDAGFERLDFQVDASDLTIDPGKFLPEALPIPSAQVIGSIDLAKNEVRLEKLDAAYFDARIQGELSYLMPESLGQAPGLKSELEIIGTVTPREVLRGWPTGAARDARTWIDENLPKASLFNVKYHMDIPRGVISPSGGLADEFLTLTFDAKDATVIYVPGMSPIRGLTARGLLRGNSFWLDVDRGRVKDVAVTGGRIRMNRFVPKGDLAEFNVKLAGPLTSMLTILDEEPLGFMSDAKLDPNDFSGDATFDLTVTRPMLSDVPEEDLGFDGKGTFSNLTITQIGPGIPIHDGTGNVTLTNDQLTISGDAETDGTTGTFSFTRRFTADETMTLDIDGILDAASADAIGLPLRRFARGNVRTRLRATGREEYFQQMDIEADLTAATIATDDSNIIKARGEPGEAFASVKFGQGDEPLNIETLRFTMARANVEGNAVVTQEGYLEALELPRLFIDDVMDLSLRLTREPGSLSVAIEGEYADISPLIDAFINRKSDTDPLPGAISIDAALNTVELKNSVRMEDIALTVRHDGLGVRQGEAIGTFADGGTLSVNVSGNPNGIGKDISVVTDQFGRLLNGIFGVDSVSGGDAILTATAIDSGPLAGTIRATDIRIQDAPTIAQLLSIGSFDGLANVMNGEGIEFSELVGDVQMENGVLRLVDARMTGSALGLSANGTLDLKGGQFGMRGAVAPAYAVNGLLGNLPGLGELFTSRQGEGVFAVAYRIDGPMMEPTISVNSLTALTPGIFRRMFEPVEGEVPTTDEILNAAEETAGLDEDRDHVTTPELLREYENRRSGLSP